MRVTRAYVGSVGAGLCLVAAAVVALFVLSAVVAVRGWPGIDPEDDVPQVTLADGRAASPGGDAADGTPVAVAAALDGTTPIVLGGAGAPGASPDARGRTRRDGGRGTGDVDQTPAPSPAPGGSATPQAGGSPGAPSTPSTPGSPLADAIRETGDGVAGTTDPVLPGSGSAVTQVTDTVADTVEGGGQAAGGAVQQVTERSGQAVRTTGSAVEGVAGGDVAGAVENVGKAVDGLLGGAK
jgi:hypothetical protein